MIICEFCRKKTDYEVREIKKTKEIKNITINYRGKEAYCKECGEKIFVDEIQDYNLKKIDKKYRKEKDLITISEIEDILDKYDIGKRPLSLLLGWGEVTLTRYLDGDIPTKEYSDKLKKILNDPDYMAEILEKNRDKVTEHAYESCRNALEKILCEEKLKTESKIDSVVKYLLNNCVEITPLALQKLLYYSQSFYKVFTGEFLFKNDCQAWVHGPVYSSIYHKYKNYGYNPIEENSVEYNDIKLDETEKEVLDSIIRNFGCYSGKTLEKMTHMELPWEEARKDLDSNEESTRIIEKELIESYFNKIESKYEMLNISDIKDYSTDLFEKVCN